MEKVRWGLLSTANINRRVIPAIRSSQRGDLIAVASRSTKKAQEYAQKWDIPKSFGGYQDILDSGTIDAIYISLPNHMHAEWSIKALQAGLHVLCEKPFALSLMDVDSMIAASKNHKRVLAEAFMYRHHPQTKIAGEWAHNGKLGEITLVQSAFNFSLQSFDNIRFNPEYGGGALWDVGVYPVSFAQFIYRTPPKWVIGFQQKGKTDVDEIFVGQLGYTSPTTNDSCFSQIACSIRTPFYTKAEVIGTEGRLSINRPFVGLEDTHGLMFYPHTGKPQKIEVEPKNLYLGQIEDMNSAILYNQPNYLTLDETRNHVRTVLALYESARTGEFVWL